MMHAMKPVILWTALLGCLLPVGVQAQGRIFRTEMIPYDTRHDADARNVAKSGYVVPLDFPLSSARTGVKVDLPLVWSDGNVYMHLENVPSAYVLEINGREVATVEDTATPAEFDVTEWVRQGVNDLSLRFFEAGSRALSRHKPAGKPFAGCRIYYQDKRSVLDYDVVIRPDSLGRDFGVLELNAVVQNAYNYEEPVTLCYDIYAPNGELIDYNVVERVLPGRSVDTVRFSTFVYGAFANKWQPGVKNPRLYRVMLFTRRHGAYKEYLPMKVGFGRTTFEQGRLMRFGQPLTLKKTVCNATDRTATAARLAALKKQGFNTIEPDYPQPVWFYEECDKLGLYVIDKADIDLPEKRDDRTVGGTPANDPRLEDEFVERVKAMYYRSRNFSCVVAYALGNPSGNGYNMYKAYEWLKSVEKNRPVIYSDARGEWNSDL